MEERTRRAVEESKAAGDRIRANREQKQQERIPNENDAHCLIDAIVLNTLNGLDEDQINLEYPDDPKSTKEALNSAKSDEWRTAIKDELKSIADMHVYTLVRSPKAAGS
jgi:hypothetical protein